MSHVFMALLLIELIMMQVKEYSSVGVSYIIANGIPCTLMLLVLCDIFYRNYLKPLNKHHVILFRQLCALLVVFTVCSVSFVLLATTYLSYPKVNATGITATVLYFICWLMIAVGFCFVMPGMCKQRDTYPMYRIILASLYILFAFAYPFVLMVAIHATEASGNKNNLVGDKLFSADALSLACLPLVTLAIVHLIFVLPQVFLNCCRTNDGEHSWIKYALESILMACIAIHFLFELRGGEKAKSQPKMVHSSRSSQRVADIIINIVVWIAAYVLFFFPWHDPRDKEI